jgi:Leucine-rich repeat (LRR) protein
VLKYLNNLTKNTNNNMAAISSPPATLRYVELIEAIPCDLEGSEAASLIEATPLYECTEVPSNVPPGVVVAMRRSYCDKAGHTQIPSGRKGELSGLPHHLIAGIGSYLDPQSAGSLRAACPDLTKIDKVAHEMETWKDVKRAAPDQLQQLMRHFDRAHSSNPSSAPLLKIHGLLESQLTSLPTEALEMLRIDKSQTICPAKLLRMFNVLNDLALLKFTHSLIEGPSTFSAIPGLPELHALPTEESTPEDKLTFFKNCSQKANEIRTWMESHQEELATMPNTELTIYNFAPPEIKYFKRLKILKIRTSNFPLPRSIGELTNLETLEFKTSECSCVPEEIGNLIKLRILSLYLCELKSLPKALNKLKRLRAIDISYNYFRECPPQLAELPYLECIDISSNPLTTKPKQPENPDRRFILNPNPLTVSIFDRIKYFYSKCLAKQLSFDDLSEIEKRKAEGMTYENQLNLLMQAQRTHNLAKKVFIYTAPIAIAGYFLCKLFKDIPFLTNEEIDECVKLAPTATAIVTAMTSGAFLLYTSFTSLFSKNSQKISVLRRRITQDAALDAAGY